jgi:hypothetical protein
MPNKINNFSPFKNLSKGSLRPNDTANDNVSQLQASPSMSKWDVNKTVLKSEIHRLESLKVMSLKGRTMLPELRRTGFQGQGVGGNTYDREGDDLSTMYDNGMRETRERKRKEASESMLKVISRQEETRQQRNTLTNIISIYK